MASQVLHSLSSRGNRFGSTEIVIRLRYIMRLMLVVSGVPLLVAGCSSSNSTAPPPDVTLLRGIIRTYATAARDLGRPPKNIDELKAVLAPVSKDPSEYLRSSRDGEEFAVVWDLNLSTAPQDTVLAYERKGVDGKRMVVLLNGETREVSAGEFTSLKFPKDYQPEG